MATGGSGRGRWSRAPEDLSGDASLRGCERVEFEGRSHPSIGKIALLARLGRGGMGVVYFGVHPRLGSEVAVKVLPAEMVERQPEAAERFVREARLAARLRSDHLVGVLDVDRDAATGAHYFVMEYVRGVTAGRLLHDAADRKERGLPEAAALDLCIAAVRGLVAAHVEGVMHRDIKPENVLVPVAADGTVQHARAKLSDLGLARHETGDEGITVSQVAMGTPGYMAPEQARDARSARKPADVFSVGATLYALLTGGPPFRGTTTMDTILRTMEGEFHSVRVLRKDVSDATAALLERCLAKDPAARFPDAPALLEALEICRASLREGGAHETVSRLDLLVKRQEQGKRVVSDPLATPTPRRPPGDEVPSAAPVALHGAAHGAQRRHAPERRRKAFPVAATVIAAGLVVAVVLGVILLRGGGPPPGLVLDSTPRGATVSVDGLVKGTTPCFLEDLEGRHAVRFELAGHKPCEIAEFAVGSGERRELRPALEKAVVEEGLEVWSEPDGASVSVDRVPAGRVVARVPVHVTTISSGTHEVRVTLPNYQPFTRDVVVRKGEKTTVRAVLQRATNTLSLSGGAPGGKVVLVREGEPPRKYEWTFDDQGRLTQTAVEAGEYRAEAQAAGFEPWSLRVVVPPEGAPATVAAGMRERDGTLRVHSRPPGADVVVDGRAIGKTPIAGATLPAGDRNVELRLAQHGPAKQRVRIRGEQVLDLGIVELQPFGSLDLSGLPPDAVVKEGKSALANGMQLAPGARKLVLERPGHAPHEVTVNVEPATACVVLPAKPWEEFQARLDLSTLPEGTRASVGGRLVVGSAAGWPASGEVEIVLRRPGFEAVRVSKVPVVLGKSSPLPEVKWTAVETRLDLTDVWADLVTSYDKKGRPAGGFRADGAGFARSAESGVHTAPVVPPGDRTIHLWDHEVPVRVDSQRAVRPPLWIVPGGATSAALDWLARHQSPDGRWDCDGFDAQCRQNKCPSPGEATHDVGVTGLALTAFVEAGETPEVGVHRQSVAQAVSYLRSVQDKEGCYGPRTDQKFLDSHAFATRAMAETFRMTGDLDVRESAQRAVNFVLQCQNPYLAWRYGVRDGDNDTMVTTLMTHALKCAERGGLEMDRTAYVGALAWIDKMTEPELGRVGYQQRGGPPARTSAMQAKFVASESESLTACGLCVRLWAGADPQKDDLVHKGCELLMKKLPRWNPDAGTNDFLYWHFGTLAFTHLSSATPQVAPGPKKGTFVDTPWRQASLRWREALARALLDRQRTERDRDERGSWDPEDPWATEGGRVYATALNCLTIQALGK